MMDDINDIVYSISIHALRVEGDSGRDPRRGQHPHFYPRPPGGGRHRYPEQYDARFEISIHALRVEGDPSPSGRLLQ